jgi:DNA topoisomerase-1
VLEGEEVIAQNGRYGPFIKKGSDTRSLTSHEQLFTVTPEEAAAIFAQPKQRRGQVTAAPLRSFEYEGRAPIVLKQGRFAPYLSDGTLNASLRGSDGPPEQLTAERALDILAERGKPPKAKPGRPVRAVKAKAEPAAKAGGAKKPAADKPAAKKAPAKKGAAKKGAAAKEPAAKPPWAEVEPFTRQFDATTAKLLTLVNGEGRKLAEAAQTLGIPAADALARYRASNFKLYASYRQARKGA